MGFYGSDLAHIHDAGFGRLANGAAELILAELAPRLAAGVKPSIVELGCGSGLLTEKLCAAGCAVLALDYSPHMLEIARQRAPQASFVQGSIYDFAVPPCDVACLLGEVINYCAAGEPSLGQLSELFGRISGALRPGGLLLFDSAGPGRAHPDAPKGFVEAEDWAVLFVELEDADGRLLERNHTTFTREGDLFRRAQENHLLRLWPPAEIEHMLSSAGFAVERLTHYGSFKLPRGLSGFLARKA